MQSFRKNKLLFILLLFIEAVFSQQVPSTNFSTIDGLPNNSVYSIYKDSRGILWVGTANGLSAIQNGVVKNYFTSDGLAHNSCWAIVEDINHNMWFGSHGGGLTFYDGKKFTITNTKNGLINDKIRKLFIYKNLLYIGTEFGISVLDIKTHKIILNKKIIGSTNLFQVMGFFEFQSRVYFQTFNDGLWNIDLKSKNIHLVTKQKGAVFSLFKTNDCLYLANTDSVNNSINKTRIVDYIGNKKSETSFGSTVFWDFVKDKRGIIYSAGNEINFSTGGIFKNERNKLTNLNTFFGVDSNEVWSLYYDEKLDVLYVGTIDKGLYKIDLTEQIKLYPSSFFNKPKLDVVAIVNTEKENLILHKNGLLFLTENKITKELRNKSFYDFAQYRFQTNFNLEAYKYFDLFSKTKLNGLELRGIKIINSIIWVNSTIGLFSVNREGVIVDYYPYSISAFDFINPNKIIYQEAYGKFCEVNNFRGNIGFKEYKPNNVNIPKEAFTILTVENKRYIASSSNGLYTYENGKFNSFYFNNIWKEKELVQAKINDKKELIIANSFGDIFIIDVLKGFKIIKKIDRKQLIGNSISFLECYKDYLFIGTEKGLNIYKNGIVRLIDEEQGLTSKAFTSSNIKGTVLTMGANSSDIDHPIPI